MLSSASWITQEPKLIEISLSRLGMFLCCPKLFSLRVSLFYTFQFCLTVVMCTYGHVAMMQAFEYRGKFSW